MGTMAYTPGSERVKLTSALPSVVGVSIFFWATQGIIEAIL